LGKEVPRRLQRVIKIKHLKIRRMRTWSQMKEEKRGKIGEFPEIVF